MPYCTRTTIGEIIGADNVTIYADRDNDGNAATITATIDAAIAWADAVIDGAFRDGPYAVPFAAAPALVSDWSARLASYRLYVARGLRMDEPVGSHLASLRDSALREMRLYASGSLRLETDVEHDGPTGAVGV